MNEETIGRARIAVGRHVLHKSIDGEVIVIDLSSGTYYSLRGSAAEVWGMIHRPQGASHIDVAAALAAHYQPNGHDIEAAVTEFLGRLQDEGLVTVEPATDAAPSVVFSVEPSTSSREFVAPVLDKYTDMQDLVLIDPVHDVTGAGWPHSPDAAASGSRT